MDLNTSILIVGGSLNGLTTALLLAHRGVRRIVVERHPRTSIQYKFRNFSPLDGDLTRHVRTAEYRGVAAPGFHVAL